MGKIIGMYDSGIGGLTVAKEIITKIPNSNIIYLADNDHVPYGGRPLEEVKCFSCEIANFLIKQGADTIIIACNMSTAASLETLKEEHSEKSIYGVIEFGVKSALKNTDKIGVLATLGTVNSGAYTSYAKSINPNIFIVEEACPEFVPIVESGETDTKTTDEIVKKHVDALLKKGAKTIILGCTHYPFLIESIKKCIPSDVTIINPADSLSELIKAQDDYTFEEEKITYYASGNTNQFLTTAGKLLNKKLSSCKKAAWINGKLE